MQLVPLELLAPARTAEIGITAIDCGADAVYIAGPAFGARAAAGNPVEDIARLCRHARLYGARVHATVNTLLQDGEREAALRLMWELYEAGVDAFLIQDLSLLEADLPPVELHASTQNAIRTIERAQELEALGFSRLVLERQLSLGQVRDIRAAVSCGLEFFIHGALCVGYSGECYLSQALTGRSANRGVCAQPCRSRYDLVDADGNVLVRDRPLLSPRDLRFDGLVPDLVAAGVTAFKIEGRLKNAAYVKNIVRHYRAVLDEFIAAHPGQYRRASYGRPVGGFTPDPDRTFQRGYTEAFLRGKPESMNSVDAAKALGGYVGNIASVRGRTLVLDTDVALANGDGLSFVDDGGETTGARIEVADGKRVTLRDTTGLRPGMRVYRNFDAVFERELDKNTPRRMIDVTLSWHSQGGETVVKAVTEDGLRAEKRFADEAPVAEKPEAALDGLRRQLAKQAGPYVFSVDAVDVDAVRFYPASFLNGIRRELAESLQRQAESRERLQVPHQPQPGARAHNRSTLDIPGELLRSRYCIKWELGLCPKKNSVSPGMAQKNRPPKEPLFLVNQGRRLQLAFDCARCEMVILR